MILNTYRAFVPQEGHMHVDKESSRGYKLHAEVVFMTEQFREYQMTVIEESLWQVSELLENDDILFDDVVRTFENILQDTNEKLIMFADKMTSIEQFDMRWIITISQHTSFISAVIGDVSLVLVRKGHIGYTMQNDTDIRQKISLFSDIIEWDMQRDDSLFLFGAHIDALMDRDDMEHVIQKTIQANHTELFEKRVEDIGTRVALSDLGIVTQYYLDPADMRSSASSLRIKTPKFLESFTERVRQIGGVTLMRLQQKLHHRQFIVLLVLVGVFLLFVLWSIVHGWIKNTSSNAINADGSVTSVLSIEDIKKEIFAFQKLDPTSEEKSLKYNTLLKELNRIQMEWRRANDVIQLKKVLNTEYMQWFNIVMMENVDDQLIYQFSRLEASTLTRPLQVFFNKWLYVAWTNGAILAWISTDIKWTAVRNASNDTFTICSMNLLKNGLYCANDKNGLYHIAKIGTEIIWGENIVFPWSIVWLSTFGSSNFYVLTNDSSYTKDNTYIARYTNVLGSQSTFGSVQTLPLLSADAQTLFSQWFSSIAIDGSFLVRSKDKKTLYQLYRNPQDKALTTREVALKWASKLGEGYSEEVKVMTTPGTRYVYLYDRKAHTLTTYLSAPAKTSDTYSTSYSLEYVMRLDFSSLPTMPIDVAVDESDGKQAAYVLIDNWVAKVPMSDLLDSLKKAK